MSKRRAITNNEDLTACREEADESRDREVHLAQQFTAKFMPTTPEAAVLPTGLLRGMVSLGSDFSHGLTEVVSSEIDLLINLEEETRAAEEELEQQEKLEISIFEASNQDAISRLEEAALNKNGRKMKLTFEMRLQQVQALLSGTIADIVAETQQCEKQAKDMFGQDDWKEYLSMKAEVAEMQASVAVLPEALETFKTGWLCKRL